MLKITEADGGIEKFAKGLAVNILESTSNALIGLQKFVNGTIEGINDVIRAKNRLKNFIHLSALGINDAIDSKYAKSKLEGEKNIINNYH